MEGEEFVDPISYEVAGGEVVYCNRGKMVKLVVPGYKFMVVVHPLKVVGGSQVLIPLDVATGNLFGMFCFFG